jgi:hypothetical protein
VLAVKGRSKDPEATMVVAETALCKAWGCRPSEMEQEDEDRIITHGRAIAEFMKQNPLG